MVAHPRVDQLQFARSEWARGVRGLSEVDALRRLRPMNSISWMVGHLAWHERRLWVERAQGLRMEPELDALASGAPASTPSFAVMMAAWERIVAQSERFLGSLATADLERPLPFDRRPTPPTAGTEVQRITYHYWDHIGEASAVRQILGHRRLPQFVGDIDTMAPYRREPG